MKKISKYHKKIKLTYIAASIVLCFVLVFVLNSVSDYSDSLNYYIVKLGDTVVGTTNNPAEAEAALAAARTQLSADTGSIIYADNDLSVEAQPKLFAKTDSHSELTESIYSYLLQTVDRNYVQAYTISSGDYSVTVDSLDTVSKVLNTLEGEYDTKGEYIVDVASVTSGNFVEISYSVTESNYVVNQVNRVMASGTTDKETASALVHDLETVGFSNELTINPVYVRAANVLTADEAIEKISSDDAGDSFSIITTEISTYEEDYEAETIYLEDPDIFVGESYVAQESSTGHRLCTARITYTNGVESNREILEETIYTEAIPAIIYEGTKELPHFVLPADANFSSGFGWREDGFHQGCDYWGEEGQDIWAMEAGTVIDAGWNDSGYGYWVRIDHGDGFVTVYAHMCDVTVEVGDYVNQYDIIGHMGNTGWSEGTHIHFEIVFNGESVDPFNYLS